MADKMVELGLRDAGCAWHCLRLASLEWPVAFATAFFAPLIFSPPPLPLAPSPQTCRAHSVSPMAAPHSCPPPMRCHCLATSALPGPASAHRISPSWLLCRYVYLNLDDAWSEKERSKNGRLVADKERFPSGKHMRWHRQAGVLYTSVLSSQIMSPGSIVFPPHLLPYFSLVSSRRHQGAGRLRPLQGPEVWHLQRRGQHDLRALSR